MSDRKAVIKNADMSEEMQQVGIKAHWKWKKRFWKRSLIAGCCRLRHPGLGEVQHWEGHCSLHQEGVWQKVRETPLNLFVPKLMTFGRYNPTWHCIVGRNFGSYVTHETRWGAHVPSRTNVFTLGPKFTILHARLVDIKLLVFSSYLWHQKLQPYPNSKGVPFWPLQLFRHFIYFYLGQVAILLFKSG